MLYLSFVMTFVYCKNDFIKLFQDGEFQTLYRRDDSLGNHQDIDQVAPGVAVSTKRNHSEVGAPKNERHNSIFVYKAQGKKYVSTTKLVVEPVREINLLTSLLHVGPKSLLRPYLFTHRISWD